MRLDFASYQDKVKGCWVGKNIGGVFGEPFELKRQWNDATFYTQDLSMGPPPNDDLDLQIVWLTAVERYGRQVNASILGDYWLNFVTPTWVEYGTGKANLRAGMAPPISGRLDNQYCNSCGCFIRSEIWACLAPGNPALAARYAYEDAIVDHAEDGMQAELFCAALQSAAFVERDPYKLIDIALSYVPAEGRFAEAIHAALDAKKAGVPYREAIARIHAAAPGTFGVQGVTLEEARKRSDAMGFEEIGEPGLDAPENCGIFIAAWLYGKDFEERMILCNAAGEDADCTCATLGALLGIIDGASGIPEKWAAPLGDRIVTKCINNTSGGVWVPKTCAQLADRIMRVTPGFLGTQLCDLFASGGYAIECQENLYCPRTDEYMHRMNGGAMDHHLTSSQLAALGSYVLRTETPCFETLVDLMGDAAFRHGQEKHIRVTVRSRMEMKQQEWARITLYTPEGVTLTSARQYMAPLNNLWGAKAEAEFVFTADDYPSARLELLIDVQLEGRHTCGVTKVVLARQ